MTIVPDEVTALGRYAYDLAATLRSALDSAGHSVNTLTQGGWSGEAADAYSAGWQECQDSGNKIIEALSKIASSVGISAETISRADKRFAAEIPRLDMS